MSTLTRADVVKHLRDHFDIPLAQVAALINSPEHPMGLRDTLAGQFVAAQIAWDGMEGQDVAHTVAMGYEYADAMLEARQ